MIRDILGSHSLLFSMAALGITIFMKILYCTDMEFAPVAGLLPMVSLIAPDLVFWGGVMALFWLIEFRFQRFWVLLGTALVAMLLLLLAAVNLLLMLVTGVQLSYSAVGYGLTRAMEALPWVAEAINWTFMLPPVALCLLLIYTPFIFRRSRQHRDNPGAVLPTPVILVGLVALGAIGWMSRDLTTIVSWLEMSYNAPLTIAVEALTKTENSPLRKDFPEVTPGPGPEESKPNVILFILESTGYRHTSLDPKGPPTTPFLKSLAEQGLEATQMRTVVPHTSKALHAILCGRFPSLQRPIVEASPDYPMHCLPAILSEQGYTTAFIQSASGYFEDRPRLVSNYGFSQFFALEDLGSSVEALDHVSGDDMGLPEPLEYWLSQQKQPYFLVILTSSMHFPYLFSTRLLSQHPEMADWSPEERIKALISQADDVLRLLVGALQRHSHGRPTVLMTFGDHGQAFGEHGARIHNNVFWEEGIRVPFVAWGPGIFQPGTRLTSERSLIDVTPTVLDLARLQYQQTAFDGISLLRPDLPARRTYFACWFDDRCVGYVEQGRKLVLLPRLSMWMVYDLQRDPDERSPLFSPEEWKPKVDALRAWYGQHRYDHQDLNWPQQTFYGGRWICEQGPEHCRPGSQPDP